MDETSLSALFEVSEPLALSDAFVSDVLSYGSYTSLELITNKRYDVTK